VSPMIGPYCATKHALEAVADAFRMELRNAKIDVVIVEPGSIATEFRATATKTGEDNLSKGTLFFLRNLHSNVWVLI